MGFEVTSLDNVPKWKDDIQEEIPVWDYYSYQPGHFHNIVCGVSCTEFSIDKTEDIRNLVIADSIVKKKLEIIEYLRPEKWLMENTRTGLLNGRENIK